MKINADFLNKYLVWVVLKLITFLKFLEFIKVVK